MRIPGERLGGLRGGEGPDVLVGTDDQDSIFGEGGDDILHGGLGPDTLSGGSGDDQLFGDDGNDLLNGDAGDDQLYGGAGDDAVRDDASGNDRMWGGAGDDALAIDRRDGAGEHYALDGGDGDDTIHVAAGTQSLLGALAVVDAGAGDDFAFLWGALDSEIDLGDGNDHLFLGGAGVHHVHLGAGNDTVELMNGGHSSIVIDDFAAGDFGDRIDLDRSLQLLGVDYDVTVNPFSTGAAHLTQAGADVELRLGGWPIYVLRNVTIADLTASNFGGWAPLGGSGPTGGNFFGGGQADEIRGSFGPDHMEGYAGNDGLNGGAGDDVLLGGAGDDGLGGAEGDDILYGGSGNDTFTSGDGDDQLYGEDGRDVFAVGRGTATGRARIWGGDGEDHVSAGHDLIDELIFDGGAGADFMDIAGATHWTFTGGSGDDGLSLTHTYRNAALFFGDGVFEGGAGHDTVWLDDQAVLMAFVGVDGHTFRIGDAILRDVEGVVLGGYNTVLDLSQMTHGLTVDADNGDDVLTGSAFDDVLIGGLGNDRLDGGGGFDIAAYGQAFDQYEITTVDGVTTVRNIGVAADIQGVDTIVNFERLQFADGWYTLDGVHVPTVTEGGADDDELAGRSWSDTILGGGGDDVIHTSEGDDVIDGGGGMDTLLVGNVRTYYTLLTTGDGFLLKGPSGDTARLSHIETLRFLDGVTIDLARQYGDEGPLVLPGTGEAAGGKGEAEPLVTPASGDRSSAMHGLTAGGHDGDPLHLPPEPSVMSPDWYGL